MNLSKYRLLLFLRYYAQIILQSCAIKSQLQDHDGALNVAYDGLTSCIRVFKRSLALCEAELLERFHQDSSTQSKSQSGVASVTKGCAKVVQMDSVNSEYGTLDQRRRTQQFGAKTQQPRGAYNRPASGKNTTSSRVASHSPLQHHGRQGANHTVNHLSASSSQISTPER